MEAVAERLKLNSTDDYETVDGNFDHSLCIEITQACPCCTEAVIYQAYSETVEEFSELLEYDQRGIDSSQVLLRRNPHDGTFLADYEGQRNMDFLDLMAVNQNRIRWTCEKTVNGRQCGEECELHVTDHNVEEENEEDDEEVNRMKRERHAAEQEARDNAFHARGPPKQSIKVHSLPGVSEASIQATIHALHLVTDIEVNAMLNRHDSTVKRGGKHITFKISPDEEFPGFPSQATPTETSILLNLDVKPSLRNPWCNYCHLRGHMMDACPERLEMVCFTCDQPGHRKIDCPNKEMIAERKRAAAAADQRPCRHCKGSLPTGLCMCRYRPFVPRSDRPDSPALSESEMNMEGYTAPRPALVLSDFQRSLAGSATLNRHRMQQADAHQAMIDAAPDATSTSNRYDALMVEEDIFVNPTQAIPAVLPAPELETGEVDEDEERFNTPPSSPSADPAPEESWETVDRRRNQISTEGLGPQT